MSLRASAREFIPTGRHTILTPPHVTPSRPEAQNTPCRFFAKGFCRNGTSCKFLHSDNGQARTGLGSSKATVSMPVSPTTASTDEGTANSIDGDSLSLYGALVSFGPGAEVLSVKLASDFSAVKLLGLPVDSTSESVQHMLSELGVNVPISQIRTRILISPPAGLAEITAEDPSFAETLTAKVASTFGQDSHIQVQRSSVQAAMGIGSSLNSLSVSTVLCTWYKASRNAWLHYSRFINAKVAEYKLNGKFIKGRKVQCRYQQPPARFTSSRSNRPTIYSVQMSNLDPTTNEGILRWELENSYRLDQPMDLIWGQSNYILSDERAAEIVKLLLERVGPLDSWEVTFKHPVRVKAVARYGSDEEARKAVREINGTQVPEFGNSKIFLNLGVSTKFKVLAEVFNAIKGEVAELSEQVGGAGQVHIKSYNPSGPQQSQGCTITIRIYGADVKSVAKAKGALENIIAGRVATDGKEVLWDKFFSLPGGLDYLKSLYQGQDAFIYRDKRKSRLILYGSTERKKQMEDALIQKVAALAQSTYIITLDSESLRIALHGGFRSILMALGRGNATLNITQSPKSISVRGSLQDLETAKRVMAQATGSSVEDEGLTDLSITEDISCAVCWTDATEPYRTPCGHIYCKECFLTQCATASDRDIPIRCLGASTMCLQVINLAELKKTLPANDLEELMLTAFKDYIRKHTETFQYCPTPDCPQIYRTSETGGVFTCPSCLTPICTACHIVNHDGQSCAENKDLSSGGNEAFEKWKKENHVKDCPKCKIAIEKTYGCNHMECGTCHVHFCWFCLASFNKGSEVYGHMTEEHETWMETDEDEDEDD